MISLYGKQVVWTMIKSDVLDVYDVSCYYE